MSAAAANIQKSTHPSGIRIVTESIDSVRSVSVGIWIKTGSRNEKAQVAGVTHFLEHMLFKGTETRSAFDIVQNVESVGGYLNAFTSSEYTCYYVRCLDTKIDTALEVLSDMVQHSIFPEEEIEKEKKVVIEEMKMYRDNPDDFIFEAFTGQMFDQHPLGRPIIGFESTVSAFTKNDLTSYVQERYTPANIIVAVAGNIQHHDIVSKIDTYFDTFNTGNGATEEKQVLTPYERTSKTLYRPIEQTHFVVGRRSLANDDPDRYRMLLLNTVLGGGMSSRLHQNIREKYGYCYAINSFNQAYTDTGMFGVYVGTDKDYVSHVRELIFNEFEKLRSDSVHDKELSEAKAQLKGKLLLAQESMSNRMTRLAKSEIYYDRYINLDELVNQIDLVDATSMRDFAQAFFDENMFSDTLLLPEEK
ncbi:MAG: insulinase family protein [Balneolales bacterium]|nr:insulinase family protein [Balneolales bacterium]